MVTIGMLNLSDYYSVVDSLTSRLKSTGILGVCDFYGECEPSDVIQFLTQYSPKYRRRI